MWQESFLREIGRVGVLLIATWALEVAFLDLIVEHFEINVRIRPTVTEIIVCGLFGLTALEIYLYMTYKN